MSGDKTEASQGYTDYWIVKTDSAVEKEWDKRFGGNSYDYCRSILQTTDEGYILGGISSSGISGDKTQGSRGEADYWIVKLFAKECPTPTHLSETNITASSARLTWDEVAGVSGYKVKYKVAETSEWTTIQSIDNDKTLHSLTPGTEYALQVKSICSVNPIVSSEWSEKQFFTTLPLRTTEEPESFTTHDSRFTFSPNPFSSSTTISFSLKEDSHVTIELFDLEGRKINALFDENLNAGSHEIKFDREQLASGIYFLELKTSKVSFMEKLVAE